MDFQTATSESVARTIDEMREPFIMVIETDNGYLGDYDGFQNMGDLLIELGKQIKSGNSSRLIRDRKENVIGRFDWWR